MHFGWVAVIVVILLIGAAAAVTYLPRPGVVTVVLTFIGILALLAVGTMALMHWGMMSCMMPCCT
jgi:hypothetical protein